MSIAESHDPYGALRQPSYRRLLSGSILGSLGAEMQAVTVGYEIYERTGSKLLLGMVGLSQFLPVLLLALPAGHAADRFNRKHLLMIALSIMAAASAGLATLSFLEGPLPVMFGLLVLAGVGRAFSIPARWSILPQLVPAPLLRNAVTWNSSGWQFATISGPAVGGVVIYFFGPAGAYATTALCLATSLVLVSTIRLQPAAPALDDHTPAHRWWSGAKFIWQTKPILATITLDLFAVLLGGATALLPVFAKEVLHVESIGLGFLRAAPSAGALTMALTLAHMRPLVRPGIALLVAVTGFGMATILFGIAQHYALSWAALALTGAFDNVSVVVRGTLIQTMTPDALRGRVAAVNAIFISSSNELGAFESGVVAEFIGPVSTVVLGGSGTILVVLITMLIWPELVRLKVGNGATSR